MIRVVFGLTLSMILSFAQPAFAEALAQPATLNIIAEGLTTKPVFYGGRAEPSSGNPMRATALIENQDNAGLSYSWSIDGVPTDVSPIPGKHTLTLQAPEKSSMDIGVTVYAASGSLLGSTLSRISLTTPTVHLYEENLLRGLSRNTLGDDYIMGSGELTVRALPYFMDPLSLSQANLVTWAVNGRPVASSLTDPLSVTIMPGDSGGTSRVEVALRNHSLLTEQLKTMFTLHY